MADFDPAPITLSVLTDLREIPEGDWTSGPLDDLALRLHLLRTLQSIIRKAEQAIEDTLVDSMETDSMIARHVGQLRRVEKVSSAWKYKTSAADLREDLTNSVSNTIAVDIATGDIDPMKRNVARATMQLALEAIPAFSSLNKAGRERLGLHLGDYRDFATSYRIVIEATEDGE